MYISVKYILITIASILVLASVLGVLKGRITKISSIFPLILLALGLGLVSNSIALDIEFNHYKKLFSADYVSISANDQETITIRLTDLFLDKKPFFSVISEKKSIKDFKEFQPIELGRIRFLKDDNTLGDIIIFRFTENLHELSQLSKGFVCIYEIDGDYYILTSTEVFSKDKLYSFQVEFVQNLFKNMGSK